MFVLSVTLVVTLIIVVVDRLESLKHNATTPTGLANLLELSPASKTEVTKAVMRGVNCTSGSSLSPEGKGRNRFLEDVARAYTPIIEKMCSIPTFNSESKPRRVLQKVVQRVARKRKGQAIAHSRLGSKRKLVFNMKESASSKPPKPSHSTIVDENTDQFLRDMAKTWRQHRRNNDRSAAAVVVQLTLRGIPKVPGRVSDWLGPKYFDEVLPITRGCRLRVLKKSDYDQGTRFRNKFENTTLGSVLYKSC